MRLIFFSFISVTCYKMQVTSYYIQVKTYKLQVTSNNLSATSYKLQFTSKPCQMRPNIFFYFFFQVCSIKSETVKNFPFPQFIHFFNWVFVFIHHYNRNILKRKSFYLKQIISAHCQANCGPLYFLSYCIVSEEHSLLWLIHNEG